ncbi:MAG: hypothetical protein CEE43_00610 [Promethearchaeota archaeon Loki_b32]|nr:MAG: hypothetical protein CEE43_00610 [Candidatus Lokiarchaeota archaeon Loki_b32]
MTDKKDFTPQEYEIIIKELMKENEVLKKRIAELESRDQTYKVQPEPEIEPIKQQKEIVISESIFSQDVVPLEMGKGKILQGVSRRECPKCGNNNKPLIREILDKTHLICDYPRMYGKKYHCGECGVEWRVPIEM